MISAVTWNQPGPRGADVGFPERLLEVIDSGRRTATYKLALLIALLDLCARHSDAGGAGAAAAVHPGHRRAGRGPATAREATPYLVPGAGSAAELRQISSAG